MIDSALELYLGELKCSKGNLALAEDAIEGLVKRKEFLWNRVKDDKIEEIGRKEFSERSINFFQMLDMINEDIEKYQEKIDVLEVLIESLEKDIARIKSEGEYSSPRKDRDYLLTLQHIEKTILEAGGEDIGERFKAEIARLKDIDQNMPLGGVEEQTNKLIEKFWEQVSLEEVPENERISVEEWIESLPKCCIVGPGGSTDFIYGYAPIRKMNSKE